jgi:cardiolipin synthase A/B
VPWSELSRIEIGSALYLLSWLVAAIFAYQILRERRSPTATVAWLAIVILLPIVGIGAYLLIGARKLKRPRQQRARPRFEHLAQVPIDEAQPLDQLLRRLGASGATGDNSITLHTDPGVAREALIGVINSAERDLKVLMYTFDLDAIGLAVLSQLTATARRGVAVKLMVDDIGSFGVGGRALKAFKDAGGEVVRFKPVWYALIKRAANLRNHRKIVVADFRRAWFGGRNVGVPYLGDGGEFGRWVDISAVVEGSAARALEAVCAADWAFASNTAVVPAPAAEASAPKGSQRVQIFSSGPDQRDDAWHTAFIKACFEARVWRSN